MDEGIAEMIKRLREREGTKEYLEALRKRLDLPNRKTGPKLDWQRCAVYVCILVFCACFWWVMLSWLWRKI